MPTPEFRAPHQSTSGAYLEYAPDAALAPHVECFWTRTPSLESSGDARPQRVLPDGCADVIFLFDGELQAQAVGTMTRPLVVDPTPGTSFLGARFRPGLAGAAFALPASALTDLRVALSELWPDSDELLDAMADTADVRGRIRVLSRAIARRLLAAARASSPPAAVVHAIRRIDATRGNIAVAALCAELGVTRQHLARLFGRHVGISPKTLARVVRARAILVRVRGRALRDIDWSALALDAGYYDQSHLIADFGELTGLTPAAWLAEARPRS
jgi:AraC-like DNA-binding protein